MNWQDPKIEKLAQAFLSLDTIETTKYFLGDILTENEIKEFSKRLYIAEMLNEKKSYSQIEKETGLSSTTIARVSKCLKGEKGGYASVLANMSHHILSSKVKKGLLSTV